MCNYLAFGTSKLEGSNASKDFCLYLDQHPLVSALKLIQFKYKRRKRRITTSYWPGQTGIQTCGLNV